MKKGIKFLSAAVLGLAAVACSSPEKMAEMAESVTVKCDPAVLEVVAGEISATVTVTYPADYFHPKAILEVTPVIVYEGGEAKMEPYVFQGEKVKDNYEVVPSDGATVSKKVKFAYAPGMESSYLELRGVVKYKSKAIDMPTKKVADGANTTYMLVCQKGKLDLKADNYQEIINQTAEGQILYTINNATVRNSELKSQSIKDFQAALDEIKANERKSLISTDVVAYASPDGAVDLIIRVLSMYSDPAVREKEIKNMSAVYKTLAKEVLPALRRARFIANVEYKNYTSEELLKLIDENIDILDETALLRAATLVKEDNQKVAIYKKAIEKYNSANGQYNLAVTYIKMEKIADAKAALEKCAKDADWNNAQGVIALRAGNIDEAAKYFKAAASETAKENLAVIDVLKGKYADAAAKLSGKKGYNAALVALLNGNNAPAAALSCDCPNSAYLRAVAAARQGDANAVKANLEKASKCEKLAARAAKDIEFAQYR